MRGLYAIVDVTSAHSLGIDPLAYAAALLRARPAAIQVRAKGLPPREFLTLLRALVPPCRRAGVPLIANDRADLAALAGCDGVHVGQGDMPLRLVRRFAPGLRVGLSTHTLEQLGRAVEDRPDYVAYGPIFATASKADASPVVGLAGLAAAALEVLHSGIPLVAIGGITLARASGIAPYASAGAVIGDVFADAIANLGSGPLDMIAVSARAAALHAALSEGAAPLGTPPFGRPPPASGLGLDLSLIGGAGARARA